MNNTHAMSYVAAWLAMVGVCLPAPLAIGSEAVNPRPVTSGSQPRMVIHDIALQPGGLLVGQMVDEAMKPIRDKPIAIQANGQTAATTATDAHGVFAVSGLRGGVHQVVTDDSMQLCRFWAPGTAPPQAAPHLRFVRGNGDVIRGQWGPPPSYNSMKAWITNPWVVGGVVVTAVGVPVLLNNLDDDDDDDS